MKTSLKTNRLAALALALVAAPAVAQDSGLIPLDDPLDQPAGDSYCVDVSGLVVDSGIMMQAHTCKSPITEDQVFTVDEPLLGNVSVTDYDLCVTASRVAAGARLVTAECTRAATQRWVSSADGQIHPTGDRSLCWTVDARPRGAPAGGGYLKRTLTLQACADFDAEYNTWVVPGGSVGR
jgi:hypothetical protein